MPDKLPDIKLPSWLDRGDVVRLKNTFIRFWGKVHSWVTWPLTQTDPLTCAEIILNLIAWQYDIARFDGEPLTLYRKRVQIRFYQRAGRRQRGGIQGNF
ncbi:Bacteriophage P2-related tail formation protein [Salmonella enterica subsp. arizonae]|uniref:Bacteriophage P2-related tail formation protein n=1 Tax=Salmonella enterica subsp. arizonae TaxID=59203 RepID=A0A3S5DFS2_SALER|nr:Bacteriophage P2-related tail formation protein [Salmonella enterica subsp. arizonae]